VSVRILIGDVRERLREMPDESVHCVVTSPPYWGLRDYGVDGQIGMERTLGEHLAVMVDVFREVRRVLRKDGTAWVNYGDCYANTPVGRFNGGGFKDTSAKTGGRDMSGVASSGSLDKLGGSGLKPKDLCMVSNRLAIALQEDGWWVRSEIIWHKPNPMPESIKDRPWSSHEKIWLLSKSDRYWYDANAVRIPAARPDWMYETPTTPGNKDRNDGGCTQRKPRSDKQRGHSRRHAGFNERWDQMSREEQQANGANLRNVWSIATHPFADAHFATFPPDLIEPCIKAGCPEGGTVLDPFGGSGTTGLVADRLKRNAILIELNPEYAAMAEKRIRGDAPMFVDVVAA
jgi:DNA modification methylase